MVLIMICKLQIDLAPCIYATPFPLYLSLWPPPSPHRPEGPRYEKVKQKRMQNEKRNLETPFEHSRILKLQKTYLQAHGIWTLLSLYLSEGWKMTNSRNLFLKNNPSLLGPGRGYRTRTDYLVNSADKKNRGASLNLGGKFARKSRNR